MKTIEDAIKLLEQKVKEANIEDEVYTLAHNIVMEKIKEVEKELDDDFEVYWGDDTMWYDDVRDDAMCMIYEKIGKWLTNYIIK